MASAGDRWSAADLDNFYPVAPADAQKGARRRRVADGMPASSDATSPVASTSVDSSSGVESLSAKVGGLQLSRRRPDFTLPPMHENLRLSSHAPLVSASSEGGGERVFCVGCKSNRRFFCHLCLTCLVPDAPQVSLPCNAYFITDSKERLSKATGVQCALLAPKQVTLCRPEELPVLDPTRCVLLLPEMNALSVEELVRQVRGEGAASDDQNDNASTSSNEENKNKEKETPPLAGIDAVVIIDSKWDAAGLIGQSDTLKILPRVKLETYRTAFWRFHPQPKGIVKRDSIEEKRRRGEDDGDDMLCSLEALFFFCRELHESGWGGVGRGDCSRGDSIESTCNTATSSSTSSTLNAPTNTPTNTPTCHCHDDLFWFFAYQHSVVLRSAARREYSPMPAQLRKGRSARRNERRRCEEQPFEEGVVIGRVDDGRKGDEV